MSYTFPRLDLMIAYSCNISCSGCISLSDYKRDGVAPISDVTQWCNNWKNIIAPEVVTIFGGEPCIHPDLENIIHLVRDSWPSSKIRLITNGFLLNNFNPEFWFTIGNFEIQVSVHRKDHEDTINQNIKNILKKQHPWKVIKHTQGHKQLEWKHKDVSIYKSIFAEFVVPYRLVNNSFNPWNSNPDHAHKICGAPDTPVLYKGKLYKCPAVANFIDLSGENPYDYKALNYTDNLSDFVAGINKPELVCGQCPDHLNAVVINHLDINNVKFKQKNSN